MCPRARLLAGTSHTSLVASIQALTLITPVTQLHQRGGLRFAEMRLVLNVQTGPLMCGFEEPGVGT